MCVCVCVCTHAAGVLYHQADEEMIHSHLGAVGGDAPLQKEGRVNSVPAV